MAVPERDRGAGMQNIPTDLLRTLVAVVNLRSFTKSAQGVILTPRGEIVVNYARRMLSINDEIVHLTGGRPSAQTLRVSIPGDFAGSRIPQTLADFRKRWPDVRFNV